MATFFSWTLIVSIVGLVTLLLLKRYELSTGRVVMEGLRPKVGHFFHRVLLLLERGVPGMARFLTARTMRAVRVRVQELAARGILFFERVLEQVLHLVRQKSQMPRGEAGASQFLQEVAAHKHKLLRRKSGKRMILDE